MTGHRRNLAAVLRATLGVVFAACIDFGYRVPPPEPADAVASDGSDDGEACVEGPTDPSTTGPQVALVTLNVDRPLLTVTRGDVVTWTNNDSMVHTVTAGAPGAIQPPAQGGFDSGDLSPGARWAYRFCAPRTAIYFCTTHPAQMNNYRVIVEP